MKLPEKHREIAHAWADGAEIEWFNSDEECWKPKAHDNWSESIQYRVKQTPHSIDWSHVDARFIVLVGFPSGEAALVTEKPEELGDTWQFPLSANFVNAEYFTSFKRGNTDWENSLVLRPTEAPKTLTKEQWAKIPPEYIYAAGDECGSWYAFITEPKKYTKYWDAENDVCRFLLPDDVGTLPDVPWEDSLCKRPNE